jgi:predicted ArsR family transcriptional regulator
MPAQRRRMIEHLGASEQTTTKEAATWLGLPTTTTRRTLEDLAAHGLVRRKEGDGPGEPDTWWLARSVREMLAAITRSRNVHTSLYKTPNTAYDDFSGTGL